MGLGVNEDEFQIAKSRSKENNTLSTAGSGEGVTLTVHNIANLRNDFALEPTDDGSKFGEKIL